MRTKTIYAREYRIMLDMLKEARLARGITQLRLAMKLRIQPSTVGKLERGDLRLDLIQLRNWLQALGISLTDFVAEYEAKL